MIDDKLINRIKTLSPQKRLLLEQRLQQKRVGSAKKNIIVDIEPTGTKSPLFFFHLRSGHTLAYFNLARQMESDHPIFGMEAQEPMPETMPALADKYATAIQNAHPQDNYILSGWSFGGNLALETARSLQNKGKKVKVILLDSHLPIKDDAQNIQMIQISAFVNGLGVSIKQIIPFLPHSLTTDLETMLIEVCQIMETHDILPFNASMADVHRMLKLFLANTIIDQSNEPAVYPGDITLIKAQERGDKMLAKINAPDNGWSSWVDGNLHIVPTPGHHFNMMSSAHIPQLAQQLNNVLKTAF